MRVLLLAVLAAAACAPGPSYRSTSPAGRRCGNRCLARYYEVRSQCQGYPSCLDDCTAAFRACAASCPDLVEER